MAAQLPWFYNLAKVCPAGIIKLAMRPMAYKKKWGTQSWIKNNETQRINAYYGSKKAWEEIPDWEHQDLSRPSDEARLLSHGYDEEKHKSELDINDMKQAAAFRGGKCLSEEMKKGDLATKLEWECQCGHRFKASPVLILLGGHWCPECLPSPWDYDKIAKGNPFFAQVWYPNHSKEEENFYGEDIFDGWEK